MIEQASKLNQALVLDWYKVEKFSISQLNNMFNLGLSDAQLVNETINGEFFNRVFKIDLSWEKFIEFSFLP